MDKEFAERMRKQLEASSGAAETSSIVESEDGVSKIKIGGADSQDDFRQVIEVKDVEQEHRKISASLEPINSEEMGRN